MASQLDRETVLKVARLGRLKLADHEVDDYLNKLGQILTYVEQLNEVDTTDVEPMAHAVELQNVFREDVVRPSLPRDLALSNAPKTDGQFFLVPQIIDAGG
ncbi:MAG: Asp-tRNA(Asn)/Glu-tRNA(Gln) amidotransferase subunit GatC [Planctomycetota bacterium]|nr:Asp-tRNA(Asn)/Glu-tRNA(Gln) amidotransferase subunit GatC [Planctomycetota bacterium]